ncbi:MAG: acetylxylan esterase [Ruminococcaceae bacterium]|nr:acetylxylan esterase [Oscillospiraceae bacterium]
MLNIKQRFEAVAGAMPRPELLHTPISYKVTREWELENTTRYEIYYTTEPGSCVRAYLFLPKDRARKHGAVLCPHPTNGELGGADPAGFGIKKNHFYALELAELGYVTLSPDIVYYGESVNADPFKMGYESGTMKVIFDHMRGVDLLCSLDCVDPDNIGCIGHSLGGHNSVFTAFMDERIKVCVSSCGLCAFTEYVKTNANKMGAWAQDVYMPLIRTKYDLDPYKMPWDLPELTAAIAPRYLFINACRNESNMNFAGAKLVIDECRRAYDSMGVSERFGTITPDDIHNFPPEARKAAYEFIKFAFGE